ncbi:uncharacterized protein LOC120012841 isoform X2 [Tripterygium wilfordii]|uniref:uncharacterized protein LOC120012841 isoform X2 n=1 Tax=Tripterygium wilfordii TaxID=458696 RepID=UPI0018F7FAAE|nr:uncharacterized protein LOC120012841 isoform X2 [Tripterygium wilfordii]
MFFSEYSEWKHLPPHFLQQLVRNYQFTCALVLWPFYKIVLFFHMVFVRIMGTDFCILCFYHFLFIRKFRSSHSHGLPLNESQPPSGGCKQKGVQGISHQT